MNRMHEFLAEQKVMRLATVSPDGMPHVVPVWYMYKNGSIYVGTNTRTMKARNVARTGTAAFCVDEGIHSPLYGVMGRGRAHILTDGVEDMARDILLRYFETMQDESAAELFADTDCILEITPHRLTEWS